MTDDNRRAREAAGLAKALAHPLRVRILEAFDDQPRVSPVGLSKSHDEPLGNVSYHVKTLLTSGAVEVVEEVPRRGAVEHVYGLIDKGKALRAVLDAL